MRARRFVWMLAIVATCAGLRSVAAGEATPKVRYHDPTWKFSILMFEQWKPAPLPPPDPEADEVDKHLVVRFYEPGDDDPKYELPDGNRGIAEVYVIGPGKPGTIEDLLAKAAKKREIDLSLRGGKAVKTKDGVPGTAWLEPLAGNSRFLASAAWKKDGTQLGVWMAAHYVSAAGAMGLERVVNSVMWSDDRGGAAPAAPSCAALLDGLKLEPERRKAIERSLVRDWKVLLSPGKQYLVVYNSKKGKNDRLAQTIGERIEAIRKQQYELLFPPSGPIDATSVVRVCGDRGEYLAYGAPADSEGYWSAYDQELVFYDNNPSRTPDDSTLSVLYHEAFHQYVFYAAGHVSPHSWFNEGHGDFFSGARFKDGKFRIEPYPWDLFPIQKAIEKGSRGDTRDDPKAKEKGPEEGYYPLKRLVAMTQDEYYLRPEVCYAQGWSLVYFLRAIVPTKPEWKAKWGGILDTYFQTLCAASADAARRPQPEKPKSGDGSPPDAAPGTAPAGDEGSGRSTAPPSTDDEDPAVLSKALEAAFQGVDFDELEAAWKSAISAVVVKESTVRRLR